MEPRKDGLCPPMTRPPTAVRNHDDYSVDRIAAPVVEIPGKGILDPEKVDRISRELSDAEVDRLMVKLTRRRKIAKIKDDVLKTANLDHSDRSELIATLNRLSSK